MVRHNGLDDSPQLQIDIDQRKAQALGVDIDDINDTLQTAWGSSYVNDFMDRGRGEESLCAGSCAVSHAAR
ncbi:putative multidrug efflux pump [Escherichia coli]|uniref:Putative multidrug efflux pump n=1 Tax=Escherichia coli TaxID=562 RepID=A0A376KQZ9_ECOLX|nr:putative multidrug efflux pump [Escherichia coli]